MKKNLKKLITTIKSNRDDILGTLAVVCATSATIMIINMIY